MDRKCIHYGRAQPAASLTLSILWDESDDLSARDVLGSVGLPCDDAGRFAAAD